jgi:hypothetical protein
MSCIKMKSEANIKAHPSATLRFHQIVIRQTYGPLYAL